MQEIQNLPCNEVTDITENINSDLLLYSSGIWCLCNNFKSFILSTFESHVESDNGTYVFCCMVLDQHIKRQVLGLLLWAGIYSLINCMKMD